MKYEVHWEELQTFHTIVDADSFEEAQRKVEDGDFEEAHDSGWAPEIVVYYVKGAE